MLTWFAYSYLLIRYLGFWFPGITFGDEDGIEVTSFASWVSCTPHDSV